MGYDLGRFEAEVDEELLCPICSSVLEDPVQAGACEHAFCRQCIETWLRQANTCPVDREPMTNDDLMPPPRILRNLLGRLMVSCENRSHGCQESMRLEQMCQHEEECEFNPNRPVHCMVGCGLPIPQADQATHNCVTLLRDRLDAQTAHGRELEQRIDEVNQVLAEHARELVELKQAMSQLTGEPSGSQSSGGPAGTDDLEVWTRSLPRAKVTRWGGMISTPDAILQTAIRRALQEAGCPSAAVTGLMDKGHERAWPRGLRNLEVRQRNRTAYSRYVARRIPSRQAVVILASENRHLSQDLLIDPAMIIIFANGVE